MKRKTQQTVGNQTRSRPEGSARPSRSRRQEPAPAKVESDTGPSGKPEEPEEPEKPEKPFPIVGIGASAGGLQAFEAFLSGMPTDAETGMAFVLVQHLAPDHKSILRDLVTRYTRKEVYEVEDGMAVRPDCAYIIPPNRDMAFLNGRLQLLEPSAPRGLRLPIDFFFRSLAQDQRERAICIVLSGTGSDGSLGVRAVKGEGGMAMAQDPDTTEYDSMPRSAIATGLVDYILPPAQMPAQLIVYASHPYGERSGLVAAPTPRSEGTLTKLFVLLRDGTGHDFSQYKENTMNRRVERRMALHQIEHAEDYLRFARQNPDEVHALFRDLLIGVTSFYRDPDAFDVLQARVIPGIFAGKSPGDTVRVWVCGCSTGEEAYSIAILLQEHMDDLKLTFKVQVFATDIDGRAIEHARNGVFPASIAADISPERLTRFFTEDADGNGYRIRKIIRDLLIFSEQDVIKDPPFSNLDLISCRNLLIYLGGSLQQKLIPLFHYGLVPNGVLFLGTSESMGAFNMLFEPLDPKWKLYRRKEDLGGLQRPAIGGMLSAVPDVGGRSRPSKQGGPDEGLGALRETTERALLEHYAQAAVLVNERGDVLYVFGRTGRYLEPAPGDGHANILSMAREGLRRELSAALRRVVTHGENATYRGLRIRTNGGFVTANLTVRPAPDTADDSGLRGRFLVILEEVPPEEHARSSEDDSDAVKHDARVTALEQELIAKEEYLQTTLEEMESSNEELKSANEEMQSVNEELQSTNEELETSKEELQSVNEELATVNTELQSKLTDLSQINDDMNNLLAGTGVGTLFVDRRLLISRFTPATTKVINLIQSDVGRPVGHIVSNLVGYDRLVDDVRGVLENLSSHEAEVETKAGTWYLMRILPYRTLENSIEGVVITFVDITELKRVESRLRESERFHAMVNQAIAGVGQVDPEGRLIYVNDHLCTTMGYSQTELLHRKIADLTHLDDNQRNSTRFDALVAGGSDYRIELRLLRKDGTPVWVHCRLSGIRDGAGRVESVVAVAIDISERKQFEKELTTSRDDRASDLDAMTRLQKIGALIVEEGNMGAILEEVVEAAIAITAADMGVVQLLDPDTGTLEIAAQRGFDESFVRFWNKNEADCGTTGKALELGERVIVEDVTVSPLFANTPALDVMVSAGVRAGQSAPLTSRSNRLLGMFSTYFRASNRPSEQALRVLDLLARQAADIIDCSQSEGVSRRTTPVGGSAPAPRGKPP